MSTKTINLNLIKPDLTDVADIGVINTNMDTIDAAIHIVTQAVPTKVSQLNNDAEYITSAQIPTVPVQSVNDKTGAVVLTASDVGAEPAITTGAVTQFLSGLKNWRTLSTDVLATVLTGLSTATNAVLSTADTVLSALGKLQAQITANLTTLTNHTSNTSNPHSVTAAQAGAINSAPYAATVSGTAVTVTISGYTVGKIYPISVSTAITAASTLSVNSGTAYSLVNVTGTAITAVASGAVLYIYQATSTGNFQCVGKGGGGTATTPQLLSGYTATVDSGQITGTMPNKVGSGTVITPGSVAQAIPQGYYSGAMGDGEVNGDANLASANILPGKSIFNVAGAVTAGTYIVYSDSNTYYTYSTTAVALGSKITMNVAGTVRISVSFMRSGTSGTAWGQVYKNGVAAGTLRIVFR
jgi:hypothetical protein